jgi:hypothetical protein
MLITITTEHVEGFKIISLCVISKFNSDGSGKTDLNQADSSKKPTSMNNTVYHNR